MEEEQPQKQSPLEMTTEQMDEKFELVLNHFKKSAVLRKGDYAMDKLRVIAHQGIFKRMQGYDLIKPDSGIDVTMDSYVLTKYGNEVLRAGGWIQYHKDKVAHDKLVRDQISSTIDTNRFQKTVLFSTIALSLATFFLSLGTFFSNERLLGIEERRFEQEQKEVPLPVVNPSVNVTLKRDTIVLVQPAKSKR